MTQIASAYAEGLFDLAVQENLEEDILRDLTALRKGFSQAPEYVKLLATHTLTKQERCQILDDGFRGKVCPYVLNFLKILTEKGYIRLFGQCCEAFEELYNRAHGILPVTVVSAVALSEEQIRKLTQRLCQQTGKKVRLHCRVEPECLGGIRLDYDGKRVDGTVSGMLDAIRNLLQNTVL